MSRPGRIRDRRLVVDASDCSVVAACRHCGATFGPYRTEDAAREAATEHWDTWHRPPETGSSCRVPGCESAARALRLCPKHYLRHRRHGDPTIARPYRKRLTA